MSTRLSTRGLNAKDPKPPAVFARESILCSTLICEEEDGGKFIADEKRMSGSRWVMRRTLGSSEPFTVGAQRSSSTDFVHPNRGILTMSPRPTKSQPTTSDLQIPQSAHSQFQFQRSRRKDLEATKTRTGGHSSAESPHAHVIFSYNNPPLAFLFS